MSDFDSGLYLWHGEEPKQPRRRIAWVASAAAVVIVLALGALTRAPAEAIAPMATAPLPAIDAGKAQLFRDFEARLKHR